MRKCADSQSQTKRAKNRIWVRGMQDLASDVDYANPADILEWRCDKHGIYKQRLCDHLGGHGCLGCGEQKKIELVRKARRVNNPWPDWFCKEMEGSPDGEAILQQKTVLRDKVRFVCPIHGVYWQSVGNHLAGHGCSSCAAQKIDYVSSYEKRLAEALKDLKPLTSYRSLIVSSVTGRYKELDLYFPDYNIAVEVNGLYYHSLEYMETVPQYQAVGGKKFYHRMKHDLCKDKGVQLIMLWEDSLRDNFELCVRLVRAKCKAEQRKTIYARACTIKMVTHEVARDFYSKYHIQGFGQGQAIALVKGDEIYSMISIKEAPSNKFPEGTYEINRYASKSGYFVVGGIQKLMSWCNTKFSVSRWGVLC